MSSYLSHFCCGCGLCKCLEKAVLNENEKGFYYIKDGQTKWLESICPAGINGSSYCNEQSIWGRYLGLYYSWSLDQTIRYKASSGGSLTAIALYLIESKKVDFIIHTTYDIDDPCSNVTVISNSRNQIVDRCGSRYSISHPLSIIDKLDLEKKYAFIGKPCDVIALRNYMNENIQLKESIIYLLSFFCMGLPSKSAQTRLLERMGCNRINVKQLNYRGNGWPGFTSIVDTNGCSFKLDYETAWGKVLGRDLMPFCKYCVDGIGEAADIACADGWYTKSGEPDFSEHEGRNITFARSEKGNSLLKEAFYKNYIHLEETNEQKCCLDNIQRSQFERRAALKGRIIASKIMRHPIPKYSKVILRTYAKRVPFPKRIKLFWGMIKRLLGNENK